MSSTVCRARKTLPCQQNHFSRRTACRVQDEDNMTVLSLCVRVVAGREGAHPESWVESWEVIEVLYSARRWPRPARTHEGLQVLTVWGRTDAGRPLVVVLRHLSQTDETNSWQIVLAAPMGPRQLEEFTAWEAQQ